MKKLILASASPRRKELLQKAGFVFEVIPSNIEEKILQASPDKVVESLALQKAMDIAGQHPDAIVIGADTIVVYEGNILGKPKDKEDALQMLMCLQGHTHTVYTGVALIWQENEIKKQIHFVQSTKVTMYEMTEAEIKSYIAGGEPMDKAGAYAIQGEAMRFIKEISGDYYTVVGLPVARIYQEFKQHKLLPMIEMIDKKF